MTIRKSFTKEDVRKALLYRVLLTYAETIEEETFVKELKGDKTKDYEYIRIIFNGIENGIWPWDKLD